MRLNTLEFTKAREAVAAGHGAAVEEHDREAQNATAIRSRSGWHVHGIGRGE